MSALPPMPSVPPTGQGAPTAPVSQPPGSLPPGSPPAATTQTHAVAAAPLGLTGRQLAPDLARGAMLLFIAIANAPWYLWGAETRMLSQHPADGSALDRVVQTLSLVFIDARSYPMFAFLFGYGIWQIYRRQAARGVPQVDAKRALRRRQWWLLLFGLAHAALLWAGDVIGAYALIGLVVVWLFLDRKDRTLAVWAGALAALLAVLALVSFAAGLALNAAGGDLAAVGGGNAADFVDDGIGQSSYLASVLSRIGTWLFLLPVQGFLSLTMPAAVLLGILAARRGLLDEPERHRKQLRRIAVAGLGLGWLGGLVTAGQNLGWWGLAPDVDLGVHHAAHADRTGRRARVHRAVHPRGSPDRTTTRGSRRAARRRRATRLRRAVRLLSRLRPDHLGPRCHRQAFAHVLPRPVRALRTVPVRLGPRARR